ncbi:MAG: hypothetical protein ACAI38_12395 [Myxococcota bacterium]|nr:hypothetical protein [Myxococcota bacterium]
MLLGLALVGCGKASAPPATKPTGVGNVSAAGGAPGATSESTPPPARAEEPKETEVERTQRRAKAAAKYLALAEQRAKADGAWASPLFALALARANGASVDQARVNKLYARVKERVCFGPPKLNLVDRTKRKKPSDAIALIKTGAEAKLAEARAKCSGGTQPLNLLVRMDVIEEIESPDKVKTTRLKPGVVLPEGQKPGPNDIYEYEIDTLKRTVFANGEVSIESRVFPFKVQEMSKDKGNAQLTAGADAVRLKEDPLDVRTSNQLNAAITERILAVVQQALDRHMEGLVKAYTTMALSTATIDAGASQEHHLIEVMAVGGQIDGNPTVAQQVSERYELPIADIKAALVDLKLQ